MREVKTEVKGMAIERAEQTAIQEAKAWSWRSIDGTLVRVGVATVRKFFCPKATDLEALSFIAFCRSKRLDPFANEVYLVKYSDKDPARIVVSRDTLIRRAQLAEGGYLGFKSGTIVERIDTKLQQHFFELERKVLLDETIPEDTRRALAEHIRKLGEHVVNSFPEVLELEGAFVPSGYRLVGGWCTVYFKDREPVTAKVMLSEYHKQQASWNTMPATMIVKVAEAHAHRKAAPSFNAALYTSEEMGVAAVASVAEIVPAQPTPPESTTPPSAIATPASLEEEAPDGGFDGTAEQG
ncbi:MAG: phage recombination protein Bet [Candidatus Bathyarchaeia archaeon]